MTRSITRFEANCSSLWSRSGVKAIAARRLIGRSNEIELHVVVLYVENEPPRRARRFALLFLRQHFRFPLTGARRHARGERPALAFN